MWLPITQKRAWLGKISCIRCLELIKILNSRYQMIRRGWLLCVGRPHSMTHWLLCKSSPFLNQKAQLSQKSTLKPLKVSDPQARKKRKKHQQYWCKRECQSARESWIRVRGERKSDSWRLCSLRATLAAMISLWATSSEFWAKISLSGIGGQPCLRMAKKIWGRNYHRKSTTKLTVARIFLIHLSQCLPHLSDQTKPILQIIIDPKHSLDT